MASSTFVRIDADRIVDDGSFHDVFAAAFGFPSWYGRNYDAWIDLMTHLDDPADQAMSGFSVPPGAAVTLQIDGAGSLKACLPHLYDVIVECSAFVNWRRIERGEAGYLILSFWDQDEKLRRGASAH